MGAPLRLLIHKKVMEEDYALPSRLGTTIEDDLDYSAYCAGSEKR